MATIGGTTFVFEQPRVARYVALEQTAGGFTLPTPTSSDRHFEQIEFPGVIESPSAIFFRTRHTGRPRFSVRINSASLTQFQFTDDDPPERCWHEIIPARVADGSTLRPRDNELTFFAADGVVTFGDVVILYTSSELTIKIPIVIGPAVVGNLG